MLPRIAPKMPRTGPSSRTLTQAQILTRPMRVVETARVESALQAIYAPTLSMRCVSAPGMACALTSAAEEVGEGADTDQRAL